jgi:hypothetical protein
LPLAYRLVRRIKEYQYSQGICFSTCSAGRMSFRSTTLLGLSYTLRTVNISGNPGVVTRSPFSGMRFSWGDSLKIICSPTGIGFVAAPLLLHPLPTPAASCRLAPTKSMKTDQIVKQLDALRSRYQKALKALPSTADGLPTSKRTELLTSSQAAIERLAPPGSSYLAHSNQVQEPNDDFRLESLMGIVEALRHDYADGGLAPIQELIRAEVFDDFLEMSEHLLGLGISLIGLALDVPSGR